MELTLPLTYTNPPMSILYTYTQRFRVVRDTHMHILTFMSLTVSESLTLRLTHSFTAPSLHCDNTLRGIRSCVTELLSDIRAVQMDDPSTLPWPTDKKPSLFVRPSPLLSLFLPYPSLKAQLQSFVTPREKKVFPRIPCRAISSSLFWALPKEQEAFGCRHIIYRFLPKAHRTGENESHVPGVCICVCENKDKLKLQAAMNGPSPIPARRG